MRGLKSTLLLLGVLAALVGYIYFVDSKKPAEGADAREKLFATATPDTIEEIQLKAEDGERTTLRKTNDAWAITEPVSADADAGEVSSLTGALSDVAVERVVEENPSALKAFGLEAPRIEVTYQVKGDKAPRQILIGDKTPTSDNLYAKTPDKPRVFLLASSLEGTLNKNTFALRNKAVLKIERDKADSIELTEGSSTTQLAKSGTEWKLVKPIAARADFGVVESLLERAAGAQMQAITAPEPTDLKPYGLDKPTATVVIGSGSTRASLQFGKTEDAVIYAKDAARPIVFTVAPTVKSDLLKEVAVLRRKDLFDARAFTANRVEITRGADTVAFEKSKNKDGQDAWKKAGGADVDAMKMEDLLSKLLSLRANTFESSTPASLKSPVLSVTVRFDEAKMETVRFGRAGTGVDAARGDEPGAAKLDASALDDVIAALDAVK